MYLNKTCFVFDSKNDAVFYYGKCLIAVVCGLLSGWRSRAPGGATRLRRQTSGLVCLGQRDPSALSSSCRIWDSPDWRGDEYYIIIRHITRHQALINWDTSPKESQNAWYP